MSRLSWSLRSRAHCPSLDGRCENGSPIAFTVWSAVVSSQSQNSANQDLTVSQCAITSVAATPAATAKIPQPVEISAAFHADAVIPAAITFAVETAIAEPTPAALNPAN